jgi:predicted ATPase
VHCGRELCSGKSPLLAELQQRGIATIEEPGRRIVAEEIKRGGRALPWVDEVSLADRAVADASARGSFSIGASLMPAVCLHD